MAPTLRDHTSAARLPVFALFITYASGYVHVETFQTRFDRALAVLRLASEPVRLRLADY